MRLLPLRQGSPASSPTTLIWYFTELVGASLSESVCLVAGILPGQALSLETVSVQLLTTCHHVWEEIRSPPSLHLHDLSSVERLLRCALCSITPSSQASQQQFEFLQSCENAFCFLFLAQRGSIQLVAKSPLIWPCNLDPIIPTGERYFILSARGRTQPEDADRLVFASLYQAS